MPWGAAEAGARERQPQASVAGSGAGWGSGAWVVLRTGCREAVRHEPLGLWT